MNASNAKDYLPLVQALAEGKVIQRRLDTEFDNWQDHPTPDFSLEAENYRIKPEPREIWVNEYPEGDSHTHYSAEAAAQGRGSCKAITRHYREVIE